jgi:hypothetical protein
VSLAGAVERVDEPIEVIQSPPGYLLFSYQQTATNPTPNSFNFEVGPQWHLTNHSGRGRNCPRQILFRSVRSTVSLAATWSRMPETSSPRNEAASMNKMLRIGVLCNFDYLLVM